MKKGREEMRAKQIELLENLVKIPGPSGFEEKISGFIERKLLQLLPEKNVKVDFQGNVSAIIEGSTDKKVMIDAHIDQIGFIVVNIDKNGLISLQYIGGGDTTILSARELIILTDSGEVNAVVNRKHSHLVVDENDEAITQISDAIVDIGVRGKKKVEALVKVGDPVVYRPSFNHLRESYYSGYGFDDRAGCYILLETIKKIVKSGRTPAPTLIFTFSVQEEIAGEKCKPLVKKYRPDMFIEVDVTFASDWSDDSKPEKESGKCNLGDGIVVYRGLEIDKPGVKLLESVAKAHKIKFQHQCMWYPGYTATEMSSEEEGIRALVLGVPLRNMHTPVEVINLKDLSCGVQLLTKFLLHKRIGKMLKK
ncbi:MAG: M42 family metallopeptidase [Candidatus Thorarchaeota archaeon]